MNIVFQIFPPKLMDCKRFYFVGKFWIRNKRINYSRELNIHDMSYLSHMEIRFEVNLLQILCPVKITNISLIKKFPQKCCPGGRSAPPAPTWLRHWDSGKARCVDAMNSLNAVVEQTKSLFLTDTDFSEFSERSVQYLVQVCF